MWLTAGLLFSFPLTFYWLAAYGEAVTQREKIVVLALSVLCGPLFGLAVLFSLFRKDT